MVKLEVMFIRLEFRYLILPIHIEDVLWLAGQALGNLGFDLAIDELAISRV